MPRLKSLPNVLIQIARTHASSKRLYSTPAYSLQSKLDIAFDVLPRFAIPNGAETCNFLSTRKGVEGPAEYIDWLLTKISTAKRRLLFSTLYTGKEEKRLIEAIHKALQANPSLTFHYIADYLRSTREHPKTCSASLLSSLKAAFPDRVFLSLYHTPDLHGLMKRIVPRRFDEGWGLWHAKIYAADDDVLISGANLSNDYFTNRQDRYLHIKDCPALADYCSEFILAGQSLSYSLEAPSNSSLNITWPDSNPVTQPTIYATAKDYKLKASEIYRDLQSKWIFSTFDQAPRNGVPDEEEKHDTVIRPFLQMGHLGIREETDLVIPTLLKLTKEEDGVGRIDWTSGYFSLDQQNQKRLLESQVDQVRVVCASPKANGFFESAGVSKYIPPAYTRAEQRFWQDAEKRGMQDRVDLLEYTRPGWTYHAKGIWLSPALDIERPFACIIGSSNYGPRSATRDMEINLLLTTTNDKLKDQMSSEVAGIRQFTEKVDSATFERPEREVGWGVRLAAWVIRDML